MQDRGFMISSLLNVFLMIVIALGVTSNHLILAIIIAIVAVINSGYLVYKSLQINKRNKGKVNGKKS